MRKTGIDKRLDNVVIKQSGYIVSEEDKARLICESIFSISGKDKRVDLMGRVQPCKLEAS